MIVPDLNLIVYAHNSSAPRHKPALRWWQDLLNGNERVGIPWVVATGFVRIVTSPRAMLSPLKADTAAETLTEWFQSHNVAPLNPGTQHLAIFTELLSGSGVGGNLVTDTHIAALAIEHQAEVHSNDNDFARFPGLRWLNPLQ